MLDIYLHSEGRKTQSMNLRALNLPGFKVRAIQEEEKNLVSPEGWTLITFIFRQEPKTTSVDITTLLHPRLPKRLMV